VVYTADSIRKRIRQPIRFDSNEKKTIRRSLLDTILEDTVRGFQSTDVDWIPENIFFRNRVVRHWNGLTQQIVDAQSVNAFKNRVDRHWKDMGI